MDKHKNCLFYWARQEAEKSVEKGGCLGGRVFKVFLILSLSVWDPNGVEVGIV